MIRTTLQTALEQLGVRVETAHCAAWTTGCVRSAPELEQYDLIILDQAAVSDDGVLEACFVPVRDRIVFLDFFGKSTGLHRLNPPAWRVVTPYPYPDAANSASAHPEQHARFSFLGFSMEPARSVNKSATAGLVWGKVPSYFDGRLPVLSAIASVAELHTNAVGLTQDFTSIPGLHSHGPVSREKFADLVSSARFLIGLGDPLVGPTALEAVAAGTLYINPARREVPLDPAYFTSQHPFLERVAPASHVCTVALDDVESVLECVRRAVDGPRLEPFVPAVFTPAAYNDRLRRLLERIQAARGTLW